MTNFTPTTAHFGGFGDKPYAILQVGSINGIQLQVWATFLFYAILIDLCDEVPEVLQLPLEQISVEMVYRSLYFYVQARATGSTDSAPVFLARQVRLLGIVKRQRSRAGFGCSSPPGPPRHHIA